MYFYRFNVIASLNAQEIHPGCQELGNRDVFLAR
jgi:hypothetical protein